MCDNPQPQQPHYEPWRNSAHCRWPTEWQSQRVGAISTAFCSHPSGDCIRHCEACKKPARQENNVRIWVPVHFHKWIYEPSWSRMLFDLYIYLYLSCLFHHFWSSNDLYCRQQTDFKSKSQRIRKWTQVKTEVTVTSSGSCAVLTYQNAQKPRG